MAEGERRGRILVALARDAIADSRAEGAWARLGEPWLEDPGASFVTLRRAGELRGCIGSIEAVRPLGEDVERNARGAAFRDPRFPPLDPSEISLVDVEVSVLSAPQPVAAANEGEAVAALRPGVDGIVLEYDGRRATFLPQVWESLADPLDFLSELRRKADLPARFWHPGVRLSRYTVEKFR